jgi:hypothetical protein
VIFWAGQSQATTVSTTSPVTASIKP